MKKVVLLSASPRTDRQTASGTFLAMLAPLFDRKDAEVMTVDVRGCMARGETGEAFAALFEADAAVVAFPLYFFCMPGMLTRFFERYIDFAAAKGGARPGKRIYAIVNCGFPEAEINEEAVRAAASFSRAAGAVFRFGVLIGAGGMVVGAKDAPFMKKTEEALAHALSRIAEDALGDAAGSAENIMIAPRFPRRLYYFLADQGFKRTAKERGVSVREIARMPYGEKK